jgi:predicted hydrocarbon binding protein
MLRTTLGDFSSIVCFKAVITGMEEMLGERATAIALTSAGRIRGKQLAYTLGLSGSSLSLEEITSKVSHALGQSGTRLCVIDKIMQVGDVWKVYTSETLCSAGEPPGSERKCTYTLGAVCGALEQILGKRLQGRHTESVLRGARHDVFEFTAIE